MIWRRISDLRRGKLSEFICFSFVNVRIVRRRIRSMIEEGDEAAAEQPASESPMALDLRERTRAGNGIKEGR